MGSKSRRNAWKCKHTDQRHEARGLCKACYQWFLTYYPEELDKEYPVLRPHNVTGYSAEFYYDNKDFFTEAEIAAKLGIAVSSLRTAVKRYDLRQERLKKEENPLYWGLY
jgi:hypothetical protein